MKINTELNSLLEVLQLGNSPSSEPAFRQIAAVYATTEQAIAVLSDLRNGVSHIYYGAVGETLGIAERGTYHFTGTIWEEEILSKIHPDDLEEKQLFELQFLYFQQRKKQLTWQMENILRMKDANNIYHKLLHRILYLSESSSSIDYALCLYSFASTDFHGGRMVNLATGETQLLSEQDYSNILSPREKEILKYIAKGHLSKEIAQMLSISINTVNRHRQNILQKLHSGNSFEAYKRAAELGII